jgi:hypothetical protein
LKPKTNICGGGENFKFNEKLKKEKPYKTYSNKQWSLSPHFYMYRLKSSTNKYSHFHTSFCRIIGMHAMGLASITTHLFD